MDFLNIQNLFYNIYQFFTGDFSQMIDTLAYHWPLVATISMLISFILIVLIIYFVMKLREVERLDEKVFGTVEVLDVVGGEEIKNERWLRVLSHLETESQAEWKTAIMEADIILDEMTIKMGYHGVTLGERMTGVEKSDFLTINSAWEAHKVRNSIAHEGSDYILSKREVKRVIDLYRQVFEEFEFI